jgi:hypothetical protein
VNRLRAAWTRIPKPYRFPLLFFVGLIGFATYQDSSSGMGLAVIVGGVLALLVAFERGARRRTRRRRAAMPYGTGIWRARVEPMDVPGLAKGFTLVWFADALSVDVTVDSASLRIEPGATARRFYRVHPVSLRWEHIAEARAGGPVRELGGKPLVVPLHEVRLILVGEAVTDHFEPITDEEAAEEGIGPEERARLDAEDLAVARDLYGEDWVPGTQPLRLLLLEDPDGFAETVARYARGSLPPT